MTTEETTKAVDGEDALEAPSPACHPERSTQRGAKGSPAASAEGDRTSSRLAYRFLKRAFDVVFSLCVIAVLLIPSLLLCLVIRIESKGPAIYKRWCVGLNGRSFPMYKFRTMRIEPPEELLTPDQYRQWKDEFKVDNDPRITKIGSKIRSFSIDELPQFLNVFVGAMSIIGPRPITDEEAARYGEYKEELLSVAPGITGYWQVFGRGDTGYRLEDKRIQMQLYYVRNRSLMLDAKIFLKTIAAVFQRTGE